MALGAPYAHATPSEKPPRTMTTASVEAAGGEVTVTVLSFESEGDSPTV
jgi:hypothetical protein